jgi:aspartyl-tRNA(Asn)/glutamyl-tRNA(Gln) amidotransferase subunit A
MRDAWALTAADLTAAYATGAATPEDALESVLGRIETVNPGLNAVVTIDLAGARAATGARWRDGQALGPLCVPKTLSELMT